MLNEHIVNEIDDALKLFTSLCSYNCIIEDDDFYDGYYNDEPCFNCNEQPYEICFKIIDNKLFRIDDKVIIKFSYIKLDESIIKLFNSNYKHQLIFNELIKHGNLDENCIKLYDSNLEYL
jgi:EAL domain-containing protein (putative c-di-GMP-specific phosphodiesterase class I)